MSESMRIPMHEVHLLAPTMSKGDREHQVFLRMLPELLKSHCGQYVAIHEEKLVDSDCDDIALVQRVHAKFGYVPIHVGLVAEVQPVNRVPHYRVCPGS